MAFSGSSGKLPMDSGVRLEDFNSIKNEGVPDECSRFWALLEVCKVARKNFRKEKKLQRKKAKKEKRASQAVEGNTALMSEESTRSAREASRNSTGKRKYDDGPEWESETCAFTQLEDAKEPGFAGTLLPLSRKKQCCSKKTDDEAKKCSNKDDDPDWNLETRTCFELEEAEGLGFTRTWSLRKKWSCGEKSNKKVNKKCSIEDGDPEWDTGACFEIEDAKGSGYAGTSASLSSSSSSKKKGQGHRKKSESKVSKKRAKDGEDRPDMPRELKDHITRVLGGKEVRLVIQKQLTRSDVSGELCRVSIPKTQIIDSEFLREVEQKSLEASVDKDVRVLCYRSPEEKLGEKVLKLRLWVMHKKPKGQRAAGGGEDDARGEEEARSLKKGKSGGMDGGGGPRPSWMYILRTGWPQFVRDNKLELHNVVQIWSFRVDSDLAHDELRLALIVLPGKQAERERVRESSD
ncbi:hypothetical protein ACJRO7_001433 [Eucalyptus globulus]|uniref:B3 domain-containing protein n=1 Tax=Eucalyptus globulus TaxID=34317 RepID=A0ABD3LUI0_EUCGL